MVVPAGDAGEPVRTSDLDGQVADARAAADSVAALRVRTALVAGSSEAAAAAVAHALDAYETARRRAQRSRLPHLRAWARLVTLRYGSGRAAADRREQEAADALAAARSARGHLRDDQLAADAALAGALRTAANLPRLLDEQATERLRAAGDPRVAAVDAAAARIAAAEAQLQAIDEAQDAVAHAREAVGVAARLMESARSWGTWDILTRDPVGSPVKHRRADSSNDALHRVRQACERARRELMDVDASVVADDLEFSEMMRTLDVWFDNVFTDLAALQRINEQIAVVGRLSDQLSRVAGTLVLRRHAVQDERDGAQAEQRALLGTGT